MTVPLSTDSIAVFDGVEYFERGDSVYQAPITDPVMPDGYRAGRWTCTKAAWPLLYETRYRKQFKLFE